MRHAMSGTSSSTFAASTARPTLSTSSTMGFAPIVQYESAWATPEGQDRFVRNVKRRLEVYYDQTIQLTSGNMKDILDAYHNTLASREPTNEIMAEAIQYCTESIKTKINMVMKLDKIRQKVQYVEMRGGNDREKGDMRLRPLKDSGGTYQQFLRQQQSHRR